jgi:hypothetical protein
MPQSLSLRLTIVVACDSHGARHDGATCLFADVTVIISRGCGLLAMLLVPLLVALDALLGVLDDDVRRIFPAAAWGWVKLGCLVADSALGDDAA